MDDVCSFVDDVRLIPNKLQRLTDIISDILKQTVECAIFIREYTGHGFGGVSICSCGYTRTDKFCSQRMFWSGDGVVSQSTIDLSRSCRVSGKHSERDEAFI